jgi:ATP-dependent Clp protease ATP-binding subunit ClpA
VFERFTADARQVVARAHEEALAFQHPSIGTEHLLLGVLAAGGAPATAVLVEHGITFDTARATLDRLVGPGGFCERDASALRTVGIDLDQVHRAAEATFGAGALDRPPMKQCRRRTLFRPRRLPLAAAPDELPFTPRAKRALERARTEAERRRHGHLDLDHLLLGLLDPKDNMAVELIRHLGADPALVRAHVLARLEDAA